MIPAEVISNPNFSGRWRLDPEQGFDPLRSTQNIESEWVHQDPYLEINHRIATPSGEQRRTFVYYTDDRESMNQTPAGEARSNLFWREGSLIMVTTHQGRGGELVLNHRYTLSVDKNTLIMDRYLPEQNYEVVARLIFRRVSGEEST